MIGRRGASRLARALGASLLALVLAGGLIGGPTAAGAESTLVSAGLRAGSLSVSVGAPSLRETVGAGGQAEFAGDLGLARVVDARGSGGGWSLRVTAELEAAPGAPAPAADALTVVGVEVAPEAGRQPRNAVSYPLTVPLARGAAPTRVFSAAPGTGMGTVAVRPLVRLRLPAGAPAGAYHAHVTIGAIAGP